ncbi:astacin [Ancylostoma duodenale]|uniref:Zinc metalloproteinase n=1 Tax=Ancylostoma duodenale TaxID=51022 RepID=A0A0C2GQW6_9BILA|nr:astacin [Ancylostoma duodenale]
MRLLLLVLLLSVCVSGGIFDTKLGQKIKGVVDKIKTKLNSTALLAIREKIHGLKEKIKAKLTLSPERKAILSELLKQIGSIKKDHILSKGDSIEEINVNNKIGELLYQGDIVLTNEQADEIVQEAEDEGGNRTKRQAFRDQNYPRTLWSNGVNYFFDPSASPVVRSVFTKGARLWMKDTCIDFRENREAPDRIRVFKENGCWSFVGRLGKQQDLSLGDGCESVGTAAHEIGHAIGFFHTQSRHDRDNFITFNVQNVKSDRNLQPDWVDQFTKQTTATNENYGIPYDYGNIMHYGANSVGQHACGIIQRGAIQITLQNVRWEDFHTLETAPDAYVRVDTPSGCGQVYQATAQYQTLTDEVGNPNAGQRPREDMDMCNYWIAAPAGARIEVKLVGFTKGLAVDGCQYAGVEIKTHADQRLTGYRFCAPEDAGVTLVSKHNIVPIITYNRFYATKTVIQYRIVSGGQPMPQPRPNPGQPMPQPKPNPNCVDNQQ